MVVTGSRIEHPSFDLPAAMDVVGASAASMRWRGLSLIDVPDSKVGATAALPDLHHLAMA